MRYTYLKLIVLAIMLLGVSLTTLSFADEKQSVEGNVICLIPDYEKGNVNPVIATEPCNGLPAHSHILMTKEGKIYYLQELGKGLQELQLSSNRRNVKVTGVVKENPGGWVLFVE